MPTLSRCTRRAAAAASAAAALLLCTVASASAGAARLPVGEADGVRIERDGGAAVVYFTKSAAPLYKRIAGKRVEFECTREPAGDKLGPAVGSSGSTQVRAPKSRAPLRTGMRLRGEDYCRIWLAAREGDARRLVVSVPLTQKGAVELDERERATAIVLVLATAGQEADKRSPSAYPAPAALVEALVRMGVPRSAIVALDSATASPPAGAVGYWSDGARSLAVVALSASGRRLFVELGPDDLVRTNVAQYFTEEL